MIRYHNPNLDVGTALRLFGGRSGEEAVRAYFRQLTGKQHVLLTSSCRAALYLTYASLEERGEVLVSPLTCSVAVLPILLAGHSPAYVDVDPRTFNLDAALLPECISPRTRAIQTVNLGGNPCEMDRIASFAERHGILLIEDCAQGLGSAFDGRALGSFGEVACFTLSKNAYGIGGGVLATSNEGLYLRAAALQDRWATMSRLVLFFRTLRALLESSGNPGRYRILHKLLIAGRALVRRRAGGESLALDSVRSLFRRPRPGLFRIARSQLPRLDQLHELRSATARTIGERLKQPDTDPQQILDERSHHSVCKLFVRIEGLPPGALVRLASMGIDAKHLEQKHHASFQVRFDRDPILYSPTLEHCPVYLRLHDDLISLPLLESMDAVEIERLITGVAELRGGDRSHREPITGIRPLSTSRNTSPAVHAHREAQ